MLLNTSHGEMSVLTVFGAPLHIIDPEDGVKYWTEQGKPAVMVPTPSYKWRKDGYPAYEARQFERNSHKFTKPFENPMTAAHQFFSFGHLVKVAGFAGGYENIFIWEELWWAWKCRQQGYTLYAPNETVMWHNWDRTHRPHFLTDAEKGEKEKVKAHQDHMNSDIERMRGEIYDDPVFMQYTKEKWGLDLKNSINSVKGYTGDLDENYFWGWIEPTRFY